MSSIGCLACLGVITAQEFEDMKEAVDKSLDEAFHKSADVEINASDYQLSDHWSGLKTPGKL